MTGRMGLTSGRGRGRGRGRGSDSDSDSGSDSIGGILHGAAAGLCSVFNRHERRAASRTRVDATWLTNGGQCVLLAVVMMIDVVGSR